MEISVLSKTVRRRVRTWGYGEYLDLSWKKWQEVQ